MFCSSAYMAARISPHCRARSPPLEESVPASGCGGGRGGRKPGGLHPWITSRSPREKGAVNDRVE